MFKDHLRIPVEKDAKIPLCCNLNLAPVFFIVVQKETEPHAFVSSFDANRTRVMTTQHNVIPLLFQRKKFSTLHSPRDQILQDGIVPNDKLDKLRRRHPENV